MNFGGEKIHFMGAGGIGVSALAIFAKERGADVSACDRGTNEMTAMLESQGIPVAVGHDAAHAADVDLLVHTSAVPPDHPERRAAPRTEKRGSFLARIMNGAGGTAALGVAGTHGKTTTTWLLGAILIEAGLDPSLFIGGAVPELGGKNYRIGTGPFLAELDESDASFLEPKLDLAVVTNVESDHLSHYGDDKALFAAFDRFADAVPEDGVLVAGADDPGSRRLYEARRGRKLSFSVGGGGDLTADGVRSGPEGTDFAVRLRGRDFGVFRTLLPGIHNVRNSLAAIGAAIEFGISPETARAGLARAHGVGRRMERLGTVAGAALYSDYAHHPTEVAAAIDAFRLVHPRRTLVVFQPHLYTRTRDYADAFADALGKADSLLLVDIYPAREEPIPGVASDILADRAREGGAAVNGPVPLSALAAEVRRLARGCEAVVMMGAGDIDGVAREIAQS